MQMQQLLRVNFETGGRIPKGITARPCERQLLANYADATNDPDELRDWRRDAEGIASQKDDILGVWVHRSKNANP